MQIESRFTESPYPAWEGIENAMTGDEPFEVPGGPFLSTFIDGEMAGSFLIVPWTDYCYQIHGGVNKKFWGKSVEICTDMGMFLFTVTPCIKIVCIVPEYNRLMRRCLMKTGLKEEGCITKSFIKRMRVHDQYIYGIYRGEVIQCQQQ